jgi:hypothetical protein
VIGLFHRSLQYGLSKFNSEEYNTAIVKQLRPHPLSLYEKPRLLFKKRLSVGYKFKKPNLLTRLVQTPIYKKDTKEVFHLDLISINKILNTGKL